MDEFSYLKKGSGIILIVGDRHQRKHVPERRDSESGYGWLWMLDGAIFQGCITRLSRRICVRRLMRLAASVIVAVLFIPLMIGVLAGIPLSSGFLLISSTLGLQAAAAMVGLGLGVDPAYIVLITTSIAIGCMNGIYEICELFAQSSPIITGWLQKVEHKTGRSPFITRYGPVIGWILHWNRWLSILCMSIGWIIAILAVIAAHAG